MIRVVREVLELWEGECVVRPARSDGASVTPVARRIETAAGPDILNRLEAMGELPLGSAVLTPGGDLPVRFLLHVVLQSEQEPVTVETVRRATANALARAADFGIEAVAFPPLGTHAGQLESDDAARAMAAAVTEHRMRHEQPTDVVVVVESEYDRDVYGRIVGGEQA